MTPFIQRVTKIVVLPPIFGAMSTEIEIVDESAGEFVKVTVLSDGDEEKLSIDPDYWPAIRDGIDRMISDCREHGAKMKQTGQELPTE